MSIMSILPDQTQLRDAGKSPGVVRRVGAVPGCGQEMALWVQRREGRENSNAKIKMQRNV